MKDREEAHELIRERNCGTSALSNSIESQGVLMEQTLFVRLEADKTQFEALLETMRRFNEACNRIASLAYTLRMANKMRLQKEVCREVRERFELSAQMTMRCPELSVHPTR